MRCHTIFVPKYSELLYMVCSPKKEKELKQCEVKRTSLTRISSTLLLESRGSFDLSACINILKSQQFSEAAEFGFCERFGEYIHRVFVSWYVFKCDFPVFDRFSDEVILDVNVLGTCVEFVVF